MVFCKVCRLQLKNNEAFQSHLNGKRHRGNCIKQKIEHRIQNSIVYVSGIPDSITEEKVKTACAGFGDVATVTIYREKNSARVQFANLSSASAALKASICIDGQKLNVTRSTHPVEVLQKTETLVKDKLFEFIKVLSSDINTSISERLTKLVEHVQSSSEEIKIREGLVSKIQQILSQQLPGCRVSAFGSVVAGLALKNTDLDLQLEIPVGVDNSATSLSSHEVNFEKAFAALRSHPDFGNAVCLRKARVPVIKFVHRESGIPCDLVCGNAFGVQNSLLLRHLQELDPRVRPVLLILRLWAKFHNVTGSSAGQARLSSYAFTWIVVFYLQQLQPPVLPPVDDLMKDVVPEERAYCRGWNVSFERSLHKNRRVGNAMSVFELIHGFFDFYAAFDFKGVVICPLLGKMLPRTLFTESNEQNLPAALASYQQVLSANPSMKPLNVATALVVQDPQELNFNTTFHFLLKYVEKFQELCTKSAQVCQKLQDEETGSELANLFGMDEEAPSLEKVIPLKFFTTCEMDLEQRSLYMTCVGNVIEDVFKIALMIIREEEGQNAGPRPAKRQKLNKTRLNFEKTWTVEIPFNIWHGRAKYLKNKPELLKLPHLAKERILTLLIAQQAPVDPASTVQCTLVMKVNVDPCSVDLCFSEVRPSTLKGKFNMFIAGLQQNIYSLLEPLIKEVDIPISLDH